MPQPPVEDVAAAAAVAAAGAALNDAVLPPALPVSAPAAGATAAAPATPAAGAAAAPPLKSVAYQPEPLSWKPAAVSCLEKASAPQAGQAVSGASDIFCNTSLA